MSPARPPPRPRPPPSRPAPTPPPPVVNALATRPQAGRAATSLARAESGYAAMDSVVARLAALDAEQVGVAAGVAPPSPQPAEPRPGIDVLLQDLERAVSSERVGNLQTLMPVMADKDVAAWQSFFRRYTQLTAHYTIERFAAQGNEAHATVRTVYTYVPAHPQPHGRPRAGPHRPPAGHLVAELGRTVAPHHDVPDLVLGFGLPFPFQTGAAGGVGGLRGKAGRHSEGTGN